MMFIVKDVFFFDLCWYFCNWIIVFVLGLFVYFFYGYNYSVEGVKLDEILVEV